MLAASEESKQALSADPSAGAGRRAVRFRLRAGFSERAYSPGRPGEALRQIRVHFARRSSCRTQHAVGSAAPRARARGRAPGPVGRVLHSGLGHPFLRPPRGPRRVARGRQREAGPGGFRRCKTPRPSRKSGVPTDKIRFLYEPVMGDVACGGHSARAFREQRARCHGTRAARGRGSTDTVRCAWS